jgi:hypothetical protein
MEKAMAYGHAERNLATVRQLVPETRQLPLTLDRSDPALSARLHEITICSLTAKRMPLPPTRMVLVGAAVVAGLAASVPPLIRVR